MTPSTAVEPAPEIAGVADLASLELTVGGMSCGACAARVERALRKQVGVVDAGVNFATSRARVAFNATVTGSDSLIGAIAALGYEAAPIAHDTLPEILSGEEQRSGEWILRAGGAWLLTLPIVTVTALRSGRPGQILAQ